MDNLLAKLFLIAALMQIGMSLVEFRNCSSLQCVARVERASRDVLKIDWRPISVFPEEAKRFR